MLRHTRSSGRSVGFAAALIATFAGGGAFAQPAPPAPPSPAVAPEAPPPASVEAPPPTSVEAPPPLAPPPPPPPPAASPAPPPPPTDDAAPRSPFGKDAPEGTRPVEAAPLAGYHNGNFYLRDPGDHFRFYPRARVHVDFQTFFGPGVADVAAVDGGTALKSRLFVRRLELEGSGSLLGRWSFQFGYAVGNETLGNANGKQQQSAAGAGKDPTADSARYAAVQSAAGSAGLADNWVGLKVVPEFNLMLGQYNAPFSLENRTGNSTTPFTERNISVRSFGFPSNKEMGLTAWGEFGKRNLNYEVGVFGGDGQNRPGIDNRFDFVGRVFALPLNGGKGSVEKLQLGVSGRFGVRDNDYVGYDHPGITSNQGFALWSPTYKDSLGRTLHVIPSGAQRAVGGELRVPVSRFALTAEAFYVANQTREAVEGFQLTNSERFGDFSGVGWYAMLSAWVFGDAFVSGDPGFVRPTNVDLSKPAERPKLGLELLAAINGIQATYDGASRSGAYDAKTPGAPGGPVTDIDVLAISVGANYWATKHVRASVNYHAYVTPRGSGTDNLAGVPGNTGPAADPTASVLHELGTRLGVQF